MKRNSEEQKKKNFSKGRCPKKFKRQRRRFTKHPLSLTFLELLLSAFSAKHEGACGNGNVLQRVLAVVTEARGLHSDHLCAAKRKEKTVKVSQKKKKRGVSER